MGIFSINCINVRASYNACGKRAGAQLYLNTNTHTPSDANLRAIGSFSLSEANPYPPPGNTSTAGQIRLASISGQL